MGGFIERQSERYNETPGDTAYVIRSYTQEQTSVLANIAQNFGFWDTYVGLGLVENRLRHLLILDLPSMLSIPALPIPTANSLRLVLLAVCLKILFSVLLMTVRNPVQPVPSPSLRLLTGRVSHGRT
jgi:hypothetical protein